MNTTQFQLLLLAMAFALAPVLGRAQEEEAQSRWMDRLSLAQPLADATSVCVGEIGRLPEFTVTPDQPGLRLVRVSLPFAPGAFPKDLTLEVRLGSQTIVPQVRALTLHPGVPPSIRRAIVTFPYAFPDRSPQAFALSLAHAEPQAIPTAERVLDEEWRFAAGEQRVSVSADGVTVTRRDGQKLRFTLIAPSRAAEAGGALQFIESGRHYVWVRVLLPDTKWPRIIEVRADSLGSVAVQAHLQRLENGDGTAPDFGWTLDGSHLSPSDRHEFSRGDSASYTQSSPALQVSFPDAHLNRRGNVVVSTGPHGALLTYLRCTADEKVPFQQTAWRRAAIAIGDPGHTPINALLEPELHTAIDPVSFGEIYSVEHDIDLACWPALDHLRDYTRNGIVRAAALGDDLGNVTAFNPDGPAGYYGMNRLNHCPPIFEEFYRTGHVKLRETAVQWCSNMHDLSLWWGDTPDYGGTRYNSAVAAGHKEHEGDVNFMWRTNGASNFCTKGFDSFFYAYEETGDPRMLAALNAQIEYARKYVHADRGECRNIGDVADFMRLYRFTGLEMYRDEALRLFRELRAKLSDGDLFSQGGQPIVNDGPFIDDDRHGYEAPFAKPYIIGYALAGLPELLRVFPDEPKLRDVVRAVADFLARTIDPAGGWRYPHPQSSSVIISQGLEHAAQLVHAAQVLEERGEDVSNLVDAVELVLQARLNAYRKTGAILSGLSGWEKSTGVFTEGRTIYDLYKKPDDRDPKRDYTEGTVSVGGAPPEGLVYFTEVLEFYLRHRPAERLFHANDNLNSVLTRVADQRLKLIPLDKGSFLRVERPENSQIGFTLWGPEWVSFPNLGYSEEELGGLKIDWNRDDETGAVSYTLDRFNATFHAEFTPHLDYVECTYTVWPKPDAALPPTFAVGPCQQMKDGIFEGEESEFMSRMWFVTAEKWFRLSACADGNPRNVQYVKGHASPEMTGAMAENGWKTIQEPRPDVPLLACVSTDGKWIAATAAENGNSICNNAGPSHRCMHSHGSVPVNANTPSTLRVHAYLFKGTLQDLRARYEKDRARWTRAPAASPSGLRQVATYGMRQLLPAINDLRVREMRFPASFVNANVPFEEWRRQARETYLSTLGPRSPRAAFSMSVLATEDRGRYVAQKIAVNMAPAERVKAYLLIPKGDGPFPAIVALHDHGAHFSIGKEKVVRPFAEPEERLKDARDWTATYYGGNFIGDELAKRGFVVFATDALFWGDRGRFEGVEYEDQQTLAANMLQLGLSWAGKIVWDDVRSAEFVQSLPSVDADRIGCIGLSMGSHRTWSLCAATDLVKCGAAICWMGDTPTLTQPGNNQTRGQSAFSMLLPDIRNHLDYPDVASIACPKPMLFFNGTEDKLFPVAGVETSYAKMRNVWESRGVSDRLVTKLWPVPHEFNSAMQREAFEWLEGVLK